MPLEAGKRARAPRQKAVRREDILEAAARLYAASGDFPSVAAIADAAGVAKGTVYIYFGTKEEVFQALFFERFVACMAAIENEVHALPSLSADSLADLIVRALTETELLLPLASANHSMLQPQCSKDAQAACRAAITDAIHNTATAIGHHIFTSTDIEAAIHQCLALALGYYQLHDTLTPGSDLLIDSQSRQDFTQLMVRFWQPYLEPDRPESDF